MQIWKGARKPPVLIPNWRRKQTVSKKRGKSQNHIDDNMVRHLPRTTAHQVTYLNDKCNVVISLVMSFTTNDWYLSCRRIALTTSSMFKNMPYMRLSQRNLDDSKQKLMIIVFQEEMSPSVIGRVMESLRNQKATLDDCVRQVLFMPRSDTGTPWI